MNAGQLDVAKRICDTLVLMVNLDPVGDGRTRASYNQSDPVLRDFDGTDPVTYGAQIFSPDVLTGNLAFQIIALGRFYHHSQDYKYLQAAIKIAKFIDNNMKYESTWGGYSAGFQYNTTLGSETKLLWRSVEHNFDVFAAARLLYGITGNSQWKDMMTRAQTYVNALYQPNGGFYYVGSPNVQNQDSWVIKYPTCDAQTWNSLSGVDDDETRKTNSLKWVLDNLQLTEYQQDDITGRTIKYNGVIFSTGGTGIQSEQTAGAAMALFAQGQRIADNDPNNSNIFIAASNKLLQTMVDMQKYAVRSDGHGIVAAVNPNGATVWPGDESTGASWRYLPLLNTAASSWTGLALQFIKNGDVYANPYADYSKKQVTSYQAQTAAQSIDSQVPQAYAFGVTSLIISIVLGFFVLLLLMLLTVFNVQLYRKNRQIEQGTSREMEGIKFNQLPMQSPGTPSSPAVMVHSPTVL